MRRVAAGAHLPILQVFEPVKRPDDRADYCLCFFPGGCANFQPFQKADELVDSQTNLYSIDKIIGL